MNSLFEFDRNFKMSIVGTDEAGRGPGAGGVWAAAVCFKAEAFEREELRELNDSKKLSEKKREALYDVIKEVSFFSVRSAGVEEIERRNILGASFLAMRNAVEDVIAQVNSALVLVDGNRKIPLLPLMQQTVVKGDSKSASIAAASILAKVERDRYMLELDRRFPHYAWAKNKGYLTKEHIEAIKKHGVCEFHRPCFLKNILGL